MVERIGQRGTRMMLAGLLLVALAASATLAATSKPTNNTNNPYHRNYQTHYSLGETAARV